MEDHISKKFKFNSCSDRCIECSLPPSDRPTNRLHRGSIGKSHFKQKESFLLPGKLAIKHTKPLSKAGVQTSLCPFLVFMLASPASKSLTLSSHLLKSCWSPTLESCWSPTWFTSMLKFSPYPTLFPCN